MARLNETDKIAFNELTKKGWAQNAAEKSPRLVEPTTEARERYARWASEVSIFFKGTKPVNFSGDNWKL